MFTPSLRTTVPTAALLMLLVAGCGPTNTTSPPTAAPGASSGESPSAASSASSPAVPSPPSPSSSAAPGLGDQSQCPITPEELQAATDLTWLLGKTLPEQPWMLRKSINASTCVFIARAKEVTDSYGQPLILRIDTATGVHAAAMEKYDLEMCAEGGKASSTSGTMRAPRGGGGGKVCEAGGSVTDGSVVKDGTAMSVLVSSDSDKILKDFSPKFEAVIAAIAG